MVDRRIAVMQRHRSGRWTPVPDMQLTTAGAPAGAEELFLGLPRSEWRRMDALEYFSRSKRCWLPALLCGFEGAFLHLNVKREVPVVSTSLRPLSAGRYQRTALGLCRIEGGETTEDVIINGAVVTRPQCRLPAGGPP